MEAQLNIALNQLERQRIESLNHAEGVYRMPESPAYRDNERYLWAVKTINEKYAELRESLIRIYERDNTPTP